MRFTRTAMLTAMLLHASAAHAEIAGICAAAGVSGSDCPDKPVWTPRTPTHETDDEPRCDAACRRRLAEEYEQILASVPPANETRPLEPDVHGETDWDFARAGRAAMAFASACASHALELFPVDEAVAAAPESGMKVETSFRNYPDQNKYNAQIESAYRDFLADARFAEAARAIDPTWFKAILAYEGRFNAQFAHECCCGGTKSCEVILPEISIEAGGRKRRLWPGARRQIRNRRMTGVGIALLTSDRAKTINELAAAYDNGMALPGIPPLGIFLQIKEGRDDRLDPDKAVKAGLFNVLRSYKKIAESYDKAGSPRPPQAQLRQFGILGHNVDYLYIIDAVKNAAKITGKSRDSVTLSDILSTDHGEPPLLISLSNMLGRKSANNKFLKESRGYNKGVGEIYATNQN